MLSVSQLGKNYGQTQAVGDVSFSVARGEIVGLLGPNGAGKTTTISMILGVLEPNRGSITIDGIDLSRERAAALSRTNFAATYTPLPGNLTVRQNLRVFGMMYSIANLRARIAQVAEQFDLTHFLDKKSGVLSSGEQARLSLAKALLNKPALLLLDEPTASLDPATARDIRNHIRAFADSSAGGVLWTSHNMLEVEAVCDRVLFLSHGEVLLEGDPKTLPRAHGKTSLEELFIAVAREPLTLGGAA